MEEQIAELVARLDTLEAANSSAETLVAELYLYLTLPLLLLMLAGFLSHEMGISRVKNVLSSGIKNILAFAFVIPTFYFFGWFVYWAFPAGYELDANNWQTAIDLANPIGAVMGPNLADNATGVAWSVFALLACISAAAFSGAVIERIRVSAFVFLSIVLGSLAWAVAAAWSWHQQGWLVTDWGYHDFAAVGATHIVAGFFALGVLINLGPRIGKFNADGGVNIISGHSMPLAMTGRMLVISGYAGLILACTSMAGSGSTLSVWTSVYGTPTTLSALSFNLLMGMSGGVAGAWILTRDPLWMLSGALAGMIACSAGLDVYWPPMAFAIGFIGGMVLKPFANLFEAMGLDDSAAVIAVHGIAGFWSVLAVGIFAAGYPAMPAQPFIATSLSGQVVGGGAMVLLGFVPGFVVSLLMRWIGILRAGRQAELAGLDPAKVPASSYPEGIPVSPAPIRQ